MKGFMGLLARAKLVELSDEERLAAESAAEAAAPVDSASAPAPPPPELPPADLEVATERGFDAIYGAAGVALVPFPAEKLLRLLDGLRAMDAGTRKTAVLAMDAADDNWHVADCVVDAQRKIAALEGYKRHLAAQVQGSDAQTQERIADIKTARENATTSIRTQIAELEQLLDRETTKSAQAIAALDEGLRTTRETAAREARRMDTEIERLRELLAQFSTPAGAA